MNRLPITRHSLLLRLADAEDTTAWNEFLEVYEVAIYRYACSRGLQLADAEDVTQKVCVAVLEKATNWEPSAERGSFGAWLFRVTRNLSAKIWNDRKRSSVGSGDSDAVLMLADVPEPSDEEKTVFHFEYRRALFHWAAERIREQVREPTWRAFWMTAVEGMETEAVATELGISASSIYTAKCRVLARIRSEIECFENDFQFAKTESRK